MTAPAPTASAIYVSTSLQYWITAEPHVFARDVQINDTAYRRLDPEYYAWLRSKMQLAKMAADAGRIGQDKFDDLRCRFNAMHLWAIEHFGESCLAEAVRTLDARDYVPPVAEQDAPSRAPSPAEAAFSEVVAIVDAIRERALSLGWTHDRLYANAGTHRVAFGMDRGLASFLKPGDMIGEVTAHSIEIILPNNVRQRFYNPDVDQPWIRRVR